MVGVAAATWLIADLVWRDRLPRSAIAAGALAALALIVVWLFGSKGWRAALGVLSALGAILLAAGTALDLDQRLPDGPPPAGALVDCPDNPEGDYTDGFVAATRLNYTSVRDRPTLIGKIWRRYPAGCRLAFEGYCIGEPKVHWLFHEKDAVWFSLADGHGYVPSADITAGPSAENVRTPGLCSRQATTGAAGDHRAQGRRLTGPIEIAAAAPGAIEVGFAVCYADLAADPTWSDWHQIGVDVETGDGITARWDTRSVPGPGRARSPGLDHGARCALLGAPVPGAESDQRNYVAANGGGLRGARPASNRVD